MSNTVSISAQIPEELGKMLDQISRDEERSKSYYVKKGLETFLKQRQQATQLEKNIALSMKQIEEGKCSEMNDEFWERVKRKAKQKVLDNKKANGVV